MMDEIMRMIVKKEDELLKQVFSNYLGRKFTIDDSDIFHVVTEHNDPNKYYLFAHDKKIGTITRDMFSKEPYRIEINFTPC